MFLSTAFVKNRCNLCNGHEAQQRSIQVLGYRESNPRNKTHNYGPKMMSVDDVNDSTRKRTWKLKRYILMDRLQTSFACVGIGSLIFSTAFCQLVHDCILFGNKYYNLSLP